MNHFESALAIASGSCASVNEETRHTISTAHQAFGGHISRGLLKRGRAAVSRLCGSIEKKQRRQVFLDISKLPNLHYQTGDVWRTVDEILQRCFHCADMADRIGSGSPYYDAARIWEIFPKMEALRRFITRYGGKRDQVLLQKLNKPAWEERSTK